MLIPIGYDCFTLNRSKKSLSSASRSQPVLDIVVVANQHHHAAAFVVEAEEVRLAVNLRTGDGMIGDAPSLPEMNCRDLRKIIEVVNVVEDLVGQFQFDWFEFGKDLL